MTDAPETVLQDCRISGARMLLESAAERLPTPDGVALAIMEAWENEHTTVQQLARLVQTDPALSGRVLKLSNSAAAGQRPVVSVPEAIVRVGMQTVGQLAVAFSLIGRESVDNCPAFDHQQYWSRCLLMALLSRGLAEGTRLAPPDDLFACGLLARIGVLGLASVYPEAYSNLLASHPPDLSALERETFGVDHNELSEAMMLDFFVPRALAEPACHHEAPDQAGLDRDSRPLKIAVLLHLAYRLSETATRDDGRIAEDTAVIDSICARLGLPEGRVEPIFNSALAEWREWSELLQLPADKACEYQDIDFSADKPASPDAGLQTISKDALSAAIVADPDLAAELSAMLSELGVRVDVCAKPSEALHRTMDHRSNVVFVSEAHLQFIQRVRSAGAGNASYVALVLPAANPDLEARAYHDGADDVIIAGLSSRQLEARLKPAQRLLRRHERWRNDRKELRRIARELALSHRQQQVLALTDQLTELPNRRAAMDALDQVWNSSLRTQTPCALLLLDIDHFKTINDRHGHAVGDQVLRASAAVLKDAVRRDETIARIGGEEFLLISPNLPLREAVVAGERLRRQLEQAEIDAGGEVVRMTVSVGIAVREAQMRTAEELMIAADKALYAAKDGGRNRIALIVGGKTRFLKT